MKKIVFTSLIAWMLVTTNALTDQIDCSQFNKASAKYLECSAKNVKEKSSKLKLKVTVGAENLRKKYLKMLRMEKKI